MPELDGALFTIDPDNCIQRPHIQRGADAGRGISVKNIARAVPSSTIREFDDTSESVASGVYPWGSSRSPSSYAVCFAGTLHPRPVQLLLIHRWVTKELKYTGQSCLARALKWIDNVSDPQNLKAKASKKPPAIFKHFFSHGRLIFLRHVGAKGSIDFFVAWSFDFLE